jgi:hypothetical protein
VCHFLCSNQYRRKVLGMNANTSGQCRFKSRGKVPMNIAGYSPVNGIRSSRLSQNSRGRSSRRFTKSCLLFESQLRNFSLCTVSPCIVEMRICCRMSPSYHFTLFGSCSHRNFLTSRLRSGFVSWGDLGEGRDKEFTDRQNRVQ